MGKPSLKRLRKKEGRHALVDGIPFTLPVRCRNSPVLMAVFTIDANKAAGLFEGSEVHPFRLWRRGLLVVTVIDYRETTIGKYIEYSIAIACTHGGKSAPRLIPGLLRRTYGTGQYVLDLPVSSEISVKGGKGIWGMPKHRASLNFEIGAETISAQYDLDGQLVTYVEIDKPGKTGFPLRMSASNYCAFRGMLFRSHVHFRGKSGFHLGRKAKGRLVVGDHPRIQWLKHLDVAAKPMATAYIPSATGYLDDYFESWFLDRASKPERPMPGLETVVDLGLSETWPDPPSATVPNE